MLPGDARAKVFAGISIRHVTFTAINEFGRWVHIGLAADGVKPRRQVLTARKVGGRTTYVAGLQALATSGRK